MQITQEVMPEMIPAMEVMRHTTLMEELTNKQKAREEAMRPTVENLKKFIDFYTGKISKVIANVCKGRDENCTVKCQDSEPVKGMWERKILVDITVKNLIPDIPIANIIIDCRTPKINIQIDKDKNCPKVFKTRVNAAIKSFTKGKKWRGR
jgi:hypothetical protein